MTNITDQLITLKNKIDKASEQATKLLGAVEQETKRLKEEFGLNDIEQANKWIDKAEEELDELDEQLENGIQKLQEMIP